MTDIDRCFRDIDQKHQVYTKKFGLIKARCDGLQGEIECLRAAVEKLLVRRDPPRKKAR